MSARSFITNFFSAVGRLIDFLMSLVGRLLFVLLFGIFLIFIFSGPDKIVVPSSSALVIEPGAYIVEEVTMPDSLSLLLGPTGVTATSVNDIIDALDRAADDARITAVVLELDRLLSVGPVHIESIGAALDRVKATGKPVFAHGDFYSQAQYGLASHADEVSLHPMGNLLLSGYGGNRLFFADLLERLHVTVNVFRVGTHKSMSEPYSLNALSDEARENNQQLVDELWQRYTDRITVNRDMTADAFKNYTDNYPSLLQAAGGDMARLALEQGFVDAISSDAQFQTEMVNRVGAANGSYRQIAFQDYLDSTDTLGSFMQDQVGVIVAQGTIVLGDQPGGVIAADSLGELIRYSRLNNDIKAVVLRIDSPGGVALASEVIRHELELLKMAGKPLVVSMGGTAASGGYWIATAADEIWASPATITGSIGVVGLLPTFENTLAEIGITTDGVGTTPLSRGADLFAGLNEPMQQILQSSVEDTYQKFINLVAESRDMTAQEVDAIAQGKVWTGAAALELGLVDNLGDLPQAIESAASLARLESYDVRFIQRELTRSQQLLQQFLGSVAVTNSIKSLFGSSLQKFSGSSFNLSNMKVPVQLQQQINNALLLTTGLNTGHRLQHYLLCELCAAL